MRFASGTVRRVASVRFARGVTLVECVLAMAVFGVLICGVMNTAGAAIGTRVLAERREQARIMAEELLSEVLQEPYDTTTVVEQLATVKVAVLGIKLGVTTPPRTIVSNADSVDRYNGYADAKPVNTAGDAVKAGASGFVRSVSVVRVSASDPSVISATETGVKRVVVTVSFAGKPLSRRVGFVVSPTRAF